MRDHRRLSGIEVIVIALGVALLLCALLLSG